MSRLVITVEGSRNAKAHPRPKPGAGAALSEGRSVEARGLDLEAGVERPVTHLHVGRAEALEASLQQPRESGLIGTNEEMPQVVNRQQLGLAECVADLEEAAGIRADRRLPSRALPQIIKVNGPPPPRCSVKAV